MRIMSCFPSNCPAASSRLASPMSGEKVVGWRVVGHGLWAMGLELWHGHSAIRKSRAHGEKSSEARDASWCWRPLDFECLCRLVPACTVHRSRLLRKGEKRKGSSCALSLVLSLVHRGHRATTSSPRGALCPPHHLVGRVSVLHESQRNQGMPMRSLALPSPR